MTTFKQYSLGERTANVGHLTGKFAQILALPAYHWVLLSGFLVVLPHISTLPVWLFGVAIISLMAQKTVIKQRMSGHDKSKLKKRQQFIKLCTLFGGVGAIYAYYGKALGVDVAVSFLVLCFATKAWELYTKRDAYVLLNLGLFVLGSAFLMSQNLSVVLLALPALMAVLMTFIALSDESNDTGQGRVRSLMMVVLPAVPLLLVLFVFFPRLPPLWSLPMAGKNATTGVSDSMSPGDFSRLGQSTELAFRVEFDGQIPARPELYWRGLVFSRFDGTTWTQSDLVQGFWASSDIQNPPEWIKSVPVGHATPYKVILEPTHQNWLFGLDYPMLVPKRGVGLTGEFTLRSYFPISQQTHYQSVYYPDSRIDLSLNDVQRRVNLQLPKTGNEQSRAFAHALFAQNDHNPTQYINAIYRHINTQGFSYTLSPPLLQRDRIDEFLFGTKAGFCEHYASGFTFLMRAVGIPARVVVGYQGGELGRDGQSWEVRQMDAHAWSEVWLDGQGWVRVDPTSFVSPERIDDGMGAVTSAGGASLFGDGVAGQWGYQQFKMLQTLRRYSDQISYYWQRDVVGYDQDKQKNALFKWFNIRSFTAQFWVMVGLFVIIMWHKRKKRHHVLDGVMIKLSAKLAKIDPSLACGQSEPYLTWLGRVGRTHEIQELQRLYRQGRYGQAMAMDKQTVERVKTLADTIYRHHKNHL
ncbi:MAG: DUF3488 and transglutaminase-like domain-containing protein [Moraxella sp.]|nr:DUF3488 and transglutaminase-like domain-containing protein [Moraxella sp.]